MEPVEARVTLEEADVRRGLFFTMTRHSPGMRFLPLFYGLAIVALIFGVVVLGKGHEPSTPELLFGAACLAFLTLIPLGIRRMASQMFARVPERSATWRFRHEGIQIQSGDAITSHEWFGLYRTYETSRAFYVHDKPSVFHVLPKRDLDAATVDAIRGWFAARAKPRRAIETVAWMSPSMTMIVMLVFTALWVWLGD
ncbi:MAG: YcxB family protein [Polyangiales bacterium]